MDVMFRRPDGTFVVNVDGLPYHVTQSDALFPEAQKNGASAPLEVPPSLTKDELRAAAVLDRAEFCNQLKVQGILPRTEAIEASRGLWPATFDAFVASLPQDAADMAQMRWASASSIRYADQLLQDIALHHAGGDQTLATALLDSIFGLEEE